MSQILGEGTGVSIAVPHGLEEIRATFGDIFQYVLPDHTLDPRWENDFLVRAALPFAIPLAWEKSRTVSQMTCHKLLATVFTDVFGRLQRAGLHERITAFGGCFSFRPQRTGTKISAHAWGIAIDLNPETNAQGTAGNMDRGVVTIFRGAGFELGRRLAGKDP